MKDFVSLFATQIRLQSLTFSLRARRRLQISNSSGNCSRTIYSGGKFAPSQSEEGARLPPHSLTHSSTDRRQPVLPRRLSLICCDRGFALADLRGNSMETLHMNEYFRSVKRKKYHRFDNAGSAEAEGATAQSKTLKRVNSDVGRTRTRIIIRAQLFRFIRNVCMSCVSMSHSAGATRSRASAAVAVGLHRNARDRVGRKASAQQQQHQETIDENVLRDYLARSVDDGRYAFYIPGNLAYLDLV